MAQKAIFRATTDRAAPRMERRQRPARLPPGVAALVIAGLSGALWLSIAGILRALF